MSQVPPPLPGFPPPFVPPSTLPSSTSPALPLASARIPGTEGMTDEEIAREIFAGGRFVVYPWCVSFVLMSLRRASEVRFLRRDQDGFGAAFGYSLLSLFFGWWGLPWGLIYTPVCIFQSATGGKDVTQEILTNLTGNPAVAQAMRGAARRGRSVRMWLLPFALMGLPVLLFAGLVSSVALIDERPSDPRYAAFERADDFVKHFKTTGAGGNTVQARAAAGKISSQMKVLRGAMFSESKRKSSFSSSKGEFLTWCELSKDRAIVLIHVPELRKFNDDAKASLGKLGWTIAAAEIASLEPAERPANLVVAIRGAILYDHLLAGKLPEMTSEASDAFKATETVQGSSAVEARLKELFVSAASAPALTE